MKYVIDKSDKAPAYIQLYTQFRNDIVNGVYKYGAKLPSKRLVSMETEVSVVTVEHAYNLLVDEGYISSRERSGFFVRYSDGDCFPVGDLKRERKAPNYHSVDGDFPFSTYCKIIRRVLSEYGEDILIKSPNNGCRELREAVASYLLRSRGIEVDSSQIIIGSGAEYLYSLIVQMLGRHKVYALEDPSYEKIRRVYNANGVECRMLKMGTDGIKSEDLQKTDADVLHVTPYNSFPSGVTATASKRNEYVRWARERKGYLIEDDFDSEFTVSTKVADTLFSLEPERTIYMNTFSKTVAPSVRIGYMILPKKLLGIFEKTVGFYSCTVPILEQYVLAEFIENGDFERHINRVRRKRRNLK